MSIDELALASTETEARAAFVSRAGGPELDVRTLLDRAARSLPGVLHDAMDAGTVLAELAAYAARRPVPAAWALDLATGALHRAPGTRAGEPVGFAAALTWVDALESGLAAHCEALLADRLASPLTRVPALRLAGVAENGGAQRSTAPLVALPGPRSVTAPHHTTRAEGEFVAHDLSALLSLPACAVRFAPAHAPHGRPGSPPSSDTVIATGPTLAAAARTATERARSLNAGLSYGSWRHQAVPAITRPQEQPALCPPPRPQWTHPLDALRSQGHAPAAILLDHDTRLTEVLPYVVRIVLDRAPA